MTTHYIRHLHPVQTAKVVAVVYGVLGLILTPLMLLFGSFMPQDQRAGGWFLLLFPFIYAAIGFVMALVVAAVYNFAAGWLGGIAVDLEPGETVS